MDCSYSPSELGYFSPPSWISPESPGYLSFASPESCRYFYFGNLRQSTVVLLCQSLAECGSPRLGNPHWVSVTFSPFLIPSRSWRLSSIPRTPPLFPVQVVDDSSSLNSPQSAFISSQVTIALNFVHSSADYRCAQPDLTPLQSRDVHSNPLSRQTGSFRRIPRRSSLLSDRSSPRFPGEVITWLCNQLPVQPCSCNTLIFPELFNGNY